MTEINPVFRRTSRIGLITLSGFFIFFLVFSLLDIYKLFSKSYFINKADLIKIDTFHLLGRAYKYSGGSKSGTSGFEFESTDRHKFQISAEQFSSINDLTELTDTLMYHDLKFTGYTKKENEEKNTAKGKKTIELYQFTIGNKNYIDIDKVNELSGSNLTRKAIIWFIFYLFLTIGLYQNRKTIKNYFY
jgi:hypothetical protein